MPIRILDAATVGRIAAGEVVERPSSVVKELIENSIDAGATSITVDIKGGGIDYMRVTDNGCGIEPGQVRLAFENHATSKLQSAEQLDDIRTLGFRGEALPSIASVSHIELTTRTRGNDTGVRLNIDGGQELRVKEIGCPEGTTLIMRDLFYNLPVRRAFLKKASYEGGLVTDAVARMILGNPGVAIRYINNGVSVYHSFGDGNLRHAVFAVYGKETAEKMVEMDASEGGTRIHGLIGVGELAKSSRAHQAFFINGRYVRCQLLSRALEEVCRTRVTIGMYPMCALNLVLPPTSVNVNVHPNKLEVRFRDEMSTRIVAEKLLASAFAGERVLQIGPNAPEKHTVERVATVREVVPPPLPPAEKPVPAQQTQMRLPTTDAVRSNGATTTDRQGRLAAIQSTVTQPLMPAPNAPVESRTAGDPAAPDPKRDAGRGGVVSAAERLAEAQRRIQAEMQRLDGRPGEALREGGQDFRLLGRPGEPRFAPPAPARSDSMPDVEAALPRKAEDAAPSDTAAPAEEKPLYRVIGVALKTYVLVEADNSLILIDQHAAHERLQYERLMAQMEIGQGSQMLLTPIVLHLTAREMAIINENLDVLSQAGYVVEPFGELDVQVRAVPFILGRAELRPAFMDTLNALYRLRSATVDLRRAEVMQMACKSAVKGGDPLSDEELDVLIRRMLETGAPPTCPHGRPVMQAFSERDLEKMFKRIQ